MYNYNNNNSMYLFGGSGLILIGVIAFIVGLVFLIIQVQDNQDIQWWVWLLFIGGLILAIIGAVVFRNRRRRNMCCEPDPCAEHDECCERY